MPGRSGTPLGACLTRAGWCRRSDQLHFCAAPGNTSLAGVFDLSGRPARPSRAKFALWRCCGVGMTPQFLDSYCHRSYCV